MLFDCLLDYTGICKQRATDSLRVNSAALSLTGIGMIKSISEFLKGVDSASSITIECFRPKSDNQQISVKGGKGSRADNLTTKLNSGNGALRNCPP
jgi:hypothetical protein